MHVPDGFMNVTMSAATGVISFGTLWAYIRSAKDLIADKFIALTGMMSALIFVPVSYTHLTLPTTPYV